MYSAVVPINKSLIGFLLKGMIDETDFNKEFNKIDLET